MTEQRMSAQTCLKLTTKQMALILGISVDGVHKNKAAVKTSFQSHCRCQSGGIYRRDESSILSFYSPKWPIMKKVENMGLKLPLLFDR